MRKILVLFAHPRFEHSVVNKSLVDIATKSSSVTFHDLYEEYPDFFIDSEREKNLLLEHDVITWHHPFYWYSCPPLLKQWIDVVLEYNWAYGKNGNNLKGKYIFNTITTGGAIEAYQREGKNKYTVNELLAPFEQTAILCKMTYLPPFAVQGTHKIESKQLRIYSDSYKELLGYISNPENDLEELKSAKLLNNHFSKAY